MSYEVYALVGGLIIGAVLVFVLLRETYNARFEQWKVTELAQTVKTQTAEALDRSRAVLKGKIGEQLAPLLPEFLSKYSPSDARFMGTPIDYVVFRNMSNNEGDVVEPIEVVLLDVKTGAASLNRVQKRVKEAVDAGRVRFETLRLGETDG